MNCQNCKHWVFGDCMVTGSLVDKDVLCNAWELSLSWEQVAETQPVIDNTAELKVGGYFVDLEAERDSYRERCKELESRLDLYYGNAYDVVVDENAKLIARVAELEKKLDTEKRVSNQLYSLLADEPNKKVFIDNLIEAIRGSKEQKQ